MRILLALLLGLALLPPRSHAQAPSDTLTQHYRLYTGDGQPATLDDVWAALQDADVVLLGEEHDDPVTHALQAQVVTQAFARLRPRPLAVSLEMFERDVQGILDEYLSGLITERHFLRAARPWDNYETDYRPVVEFARAHRLPVIAANAPRRYANRVSREGREALIALSEAAKATLAPLPYGQATDAYRAKWNALMMDSMADMQAADTTAGVPEATEPVAEEEPAPADSSAAAPIMHGMNLDNMLDAQSLWDATMAHSIVQHLLRAPDALVLHLVGGFHAERNTGIPDHLRRYRPGTRLLVLAMRPHDDPAAFDPDQHTGLGDFVILTDASLPRSY